MKMLLYFLIFMLTINSINVLAEEKQWELCLADLEANSKTLYISMIKNKSKLDFIFFGDGINCNDTNYDIGTVSKSILTFKNSELTQINNSIYKIAFNSELAIINGVAEFCKQEEWFKNPNLKCMLNLDFDPDTKDLFQDGSCDFKISIVNNKILDVKSKNHKLLPTNKYNVSLFFQSIK